MVMPPRGFEPLAPGLGSLSIVLFLCPSSDVVYAICTHFCVSVFNFSDSILKVLLAQVRIH